jgi:hypothetical protein
MVKRRKPASKAETTNTIKAFTLGYGKVSQRTWTGKFHSGFME